MLALAFVAAGASAKCLSFYIKVFYVMGKALSGELSCPCDRSCSVISGRWEVDNERVCAIEHRLGLRRFCLEQGSNSRPLNQ